MGRSKENAARLFSVVPSECLVLCFFCFFLVCFLKKVMRANWDRKFRLNVRKSWGWSNWNRLWCLHPCRHLKPDQAQPRATCSHWTCFGQGGWTWSSPEEIISSQPQLLWFPDSVKSVNSSTSFTFHICGRKTIGRNCTNLQINHNYFCWASSRTSLIAWCTTLICSNHAMATFKPWTNANRMNLFTYLVVQEKNFVTWSPFLNYAKSDIQVDIPQHFLVFIFNWLTVLERSMSRTLQ